MTTRSSAFRWGELMDSVRCPYCAKTFELTDALTRDLRERLQRDLQADLEQRENNLRQEQEAIHQQRQDLEQASLAMDAEVSRRIQQRLREVEAKARAQAQQALEGTLRDLTETLNRKHEDLQASKELELELRRRQRDLEASVLDAASASNAPLPTNAPRSARMPRPEPRNPTGSRTSRRTSSSRTSSRLSMR